MKNIILILTTLFSINHISVFSQNGEKEIVINDWIVLGAFTTKAQDDILKIPFINEEQTTASMGETESGHIWKAAPKNETVNLKTFGFDYESHCVGYAFTYIYSETGGNATLQLGSDDGIAAWVNGVQVHYHDIQRGLTPKEDVVKITLKKGWNRLLLKIQQGIGDWLFTCSIVTNQSLKFSLLLPQTDEWKNLKMMPKPVSVISYDFMMMNASTVKFTFKLYNATYDDIKTVNVSLSDNKGNKTAEMVIPVMKNSSLFEGNLETSAEKFASLWKDTASYINIKWKEGETKDVLSPDMASRFAFALIKTKFADNKDIQDVLSKAQDAMKTYRVYTISQNYPRELIAGATSGDINGIKTELQKLIHEITDELPDMSKDTVHITGHAHMDMNWLWPYAESIKMFEDNLRQTVAFMKEYPDFTMIQSQATIYKHIEQIDPPLFAEIKKYVSEGRLELGGGMWTEGDCNLTPGELITRSFLLAQRYFSSRFAKTAVVGWLPDNFGHVSQFPQMLNLAGLKYFYFKRCHPYLGTFWWMSPDSSKVLAFANDNYNCSMNTNLQTEMKKIVPDRHRMLFMIGIGDHGGGPTRKDIMTVHSLDNTPKYMAVKFTTAETFFRDALREMNGRPTHKGEMQYTFEGCYTSIAKNKEGIRNSASALYSAEYLSSLMWISGKKYPSNELRNIWETVSFNEFHDILPGSAIHESNQEAAADLMHCVSQANEIREFAFRSMADEIKFNTTLGQPVVAFNFQPHKRNALVEAEIYTNEKPVAANLSGYNNYYSSKYVTPVDLGQGKAATVLLRDNNGKSIPAQIVWGKLFPPGYRIHVQFVADNLPAGGYRTYYVDASQTGNYNELIPFNNNNEFETDYFIIGIDMKTGDIIRLKDKRTGVEYVNGGNKLGQLKIYIEDHKSMDAWTIGKIKRIEDVKNVKSVRIIEQGPVRATVETVKLWGKSKFIQRVYIYRSYPRIDFDLEAHWFEQANDTTDGPMLKVNFPVNINNGKFMCHVPFDVVQRPDTGIEVPAQQWVDISDGINGFALLNRTKYGHSYKNGELTLTCLRSSQKPDIYPDQGMHFIQYALYPHRGDWINGVWNEAEMFNVPVYAAEPPSLSMENKRNRSEEDSFISLDKDNVVLSGIKEAEDGGELIVRLAEINGTETIVNLTLPTNVKQVRRLNLLEYPLDNTTPASFNAKTVQVKIKPHEIVTLGIKF